ncbi:MAG: hypothetical protein ACK4ND_03280 [Cytophagaceae bacterium]
MKPEYLKYQLIDKYLKNQMSEEEILDFEAKLALDPVLSEDVHDQKLANDIVMESRFFKVMDTIDVIPVASKPFISNTLKAIIGAGGGAAVILFSVLFFTDKKNENETQDEVSSISVLEEESLIDQQLPLTEHTQKPELNETPDQEEIDRKTAQDVRFKGKRGSTSSIREVPLEKDPAARNVISLSKNEFWKIAIKEFRKCKRKYSLKKTESNGWAWRKRS